MVCSSDDALEAIIIEAFVQARPAWPQLALALKRISGNKFPTSNMSYCILVSQMSVEGMPGDDRQ